MLEQSVELGGSGSPVRRYRIVGVLPRTFALPDTQNAAPGILLPVNADTTGARASLPNVLAFPIGRVKEGVSVERATQAVQQIVSAVERENAKIPQRRTVRLVSLRDSLFGEIQIPLLMLLGATACVLLATLWSRVRSREGGFDAWRGPIPRSRSKSSHTSGASRR